MRKYNTKPRQAVALGDLIEKENLNNGVEIGVFWGETTFYLLERFPNLKLLGVDLWKPVTCGNKSDEGYREYEEFPLEDYYKEICRKAKNYPQLRIMRYDSAHASYFYKDKEFDFVFIDGDHTYEGVKRDIEAWKLKVSKFVCGHDIHMEGVRKAVLENFDSYNELDNFVWYTRI